MDLSKLPKMSETARAERERQQAAGATPPATGTPPIDDHARSSATDPIVGAEVWISVALGLLFVWVGWTFPRYLATVARGETFHTNVNWTAGPNAGQEVSYWDLQGYTAWTDAGVFLFGLALLADGWMLLVAARGIQRRVWLVWLALGITVLATAFNLVTALLVFSTGTLPLMSLLAVAFGAYMAVYQWRVANSAGDTRA